MSVFYAPRVLYELRCTRQRIWSLRKLGSYIRRIRGSIGARYRAAMSLYGVPFIRPRGGVARPPPTEEACLLAAAATPSNQA